MIYSVYALVKDDICVYVGCTSNLKNRLKNHKQSKDFNKHIVIEYFDNKNEALLAEKSIIKFLSIFGGKELLNARYDYLSFSGCVEVGLKKSDKNY